MVLALLATFLFLFYKGYIVIYLLVYSFLLSHGLPTHLPILSFFFLLLVSYYIIFPFVFGGRGDWRFFFLSLSCLEETRVSAGLTVLFRFFTLFQK